MRSFSVGLADWNERSRAKSIVVISAACVLLSAATAHAWMRPIYEDAIVVDRSELIVVGHLKADSIEYVPHAEGSSWEHHATLAVTQMLKGKSEDKEIPIVIHYGLAPAVGGKFDEDGTIFNLRGAAEDYPKDTIQIIDTGNSLIFSKPLVGDARDDNLWFLRRRSGIYGREPGNGNYSIVDPEDLQPLDLKDYFLVYLSEKSEEALKKHVAEHPQHADRAKRYFDHCEIERILKIEDLHERYLKLRPFFLRRATWNMQSEAQQGIVALGDVAGAELRKVFDDPEYSRLRCEIIRMWRNMGYQDAAPLLIDLLKEHEQFWAEQKLDKDWRNNATDPQLTTRRQDIHNEDYYAVWALRTLKDPAAREVIETTLKRWQGNAGDQIAEECMAALREMQ